MDVNDFHLICRSCLKRGNLQSFFAENQHYEMAIPAMFHYCTSVEIGTEDNLPRQICRHCLKNLRAFHKFKRDAIENDHKLRQTLTDEHKFHAEDPTAGAEDVVGDPFKYADDADLPDYVLGSEAVRTKRSSLILKLKKVHQFEKKRTSMTDITVNCEASVPAVEQTNERLHLPYVTQTNGSTRRTKKPRPFETNIALGLSNETYNVVTIKSENTSEGYEPSQTTGELSPMRNGGPSITEADDVDGLEQKAFNYVKVDMENVKDELQNICDNQLEILGTHNVRKNGSRGKKCVSKLQTVPSNFQCDICGRFLSNRTNLSQHMRHHTGEKPFCCDFCEKKFTRAEHLTIHRRIHTGERPHTCTICKKTFVQYAALSAHLRTHSGERPYMCAICGKTFSQSIGLTYHMRTHTGEMPFKCNLCDKGFAHSGNLNIHMRFHRNERPFACTICPRKFVTSSHLSVHVKQHAGIKSHQCNICGKAFVRSEHLKDHLVTHSGQRPHACLLCPKRYTQSSHLNRHMKTHKLKQS